MESFYYLDFRLKLSFDYAQDEGFLLAERSEDMLFVRTQSKRALTQVFYNDERKS